MFSSNNYSALTQPIQTNKRPQSALEKGIDDVTKFFKIDQTISSDRSVGEADTLKTKKALIENGCLSLPSQELSPYPDHAMFEGLRKFQKQAGLIVDGRMRPEGPTALSLNAALAKRAGLHKKPRLKKVNEQKQALKTMGLYPDDIDIDDNPNDPDFDFAQGIFQRQYNNPVTGKLSLADIDKLEEVVAPAFQMPQREQPSEPAQQTQKIQQQSQPENMIVKSDTVTNKNIEVFKRPLPNANSDEPIDVNAFYERVDFDPNGKGDFENLITHNDPFQSMKATRHMGLGYAAVRLNAYFKSNALTGSDDAEDARRHAKLNIEMARSIGYNVAKKFADAHEVSGLKSGNIDATKSVVMDLYNNEVARRLALDPSNKDKSVDEIIDDAFAKGLLRTSPFKIKE